MKVVNPNSMGITCCRIQNQKNPKKVHLCRDTVCAYTLADLNGAAMFSKVERNAGYHELELAPVSQYIMTFSTHVGLRRHQRLTFGISSAAVIQDVLHGIPGVRIFSNDIVIFGTTNAEHDRSKHQFSKSNPADCKSDHPRKQG